MMCKYRVILSIDGGGLKGVIPLRILDYLQSELSKLDEDIDVTSWVDVFSSTSASSIFTGALMLRDEKGKTIFKPNDLLNFYKKRGHQLFTPKAISESTHFPLKFVLNHFFGEIKTRNLKNHFLFYALNQAKNQLVPFSTMSSKYHDLSLGKVMHACSMVPDIYPPVNIGNLSLCDAQHKFQNPAFLAYDYARMFYPSEHLVLISIGTGDIGKVCDASQQAHEAHKQILDAQKEDKKLLYFRFHPKLDHDIVLQEQSKEHILELIQTTNNYIENHQEIFQELLKLMAFKTNNHSAA